MTRAWHERTASAVLKELGTSEAGLTKQEAAERLKTTGPNVLPHGERESMLSIFLRQFEGPLILVLVAAAAVVFFLGETVDGAVITMVLLINAAIGAIQEGKAQDKLHALRNFTTGTATVLRDGRIARISDEDVAPGDILILREGEKVPADARVMESNSLLVDESALSGESEPAAKRTEPCRGDSPADQKCMVFKGTNVLGGHGRAVVVETGIGTVIGRLAKKLSVIDTEIPLKADIRRLSHVLLVVILFLVVTVFAVGVTLGQYSIAEMFLISVAVAVSAIPEGLPVVVTVVLAAGVWRMSARSALVKRLQAVEALGQAKIIAVDKTGTITRNQMVVGAVYASGTLFEVTGDGYDPHGAVLENGKEIEPLDRPELLLAGRIATLMATTSTIAFDTEKNGWDRVAGEPTEAALLVFGEKLGFNQAALSSEYKKVAEVPFDSKIGFHAVMHEKGTAATLSVSGAPEHVLLRASEIWKNGRPQPIGPEDHKAIEKALRKMSGEGLRVLALATSSGSCTDRNLPPLCFVALFGISDAIRKEVFDAVRLAKSAGMKVVMITGDHVHTARAIAEKVGIWSEGDTVVTGSDLERLPGDELARRFAKATVFARVGPEHKLRIIEGFKARGELVAMTGDGVNDALPLAAADLGVAMGKIGTDVAKEAADIILLDDNFGNIVYAIEEGRTIYKTIKRVVMYLLSTAAGEIMTIVGALLLGFPLPLHASQIIWLNLVTDSFLVIGLALEPRSENLMKGFKRPGKWLIDRLMALRILLVGFVMTVVTLFLFKDYVSGDYVKASSIALTVLAVTQWMNAWNARSSTRSVFDGSFRRNPYLFLMLGVVILLQLAVLYVPALQKIFATTGLTLREWYLILAISTSVIFVEECRKFIVWLFKKR